MRVLNISTTDWANYAHDNATALRALGIDCRDAALKENPFKYTSHSKIVELHEIKTTYKQYDCVQVFHSDVHLYNMVKDHKNVVVYHTGTRYRQQPDFHDKAFRGVKIATDQCEFLLRQHMHYIAPHVTLKPVEKATNGKLIIGHFPSNPDVKGTRQIENMLKPFHNDFDIQIDTKKLSHDLNLQRVAECHIYVELFAPFQNGKPYGCFGTSAFEATALGCLVITNNLNPSAYIDVYGHQPFLTPNTREHFVNQIVGLHDREVYNIAVEAMQFGFHSTHGIINTGQRILQIIEK